MKAAPPPTAEAQQQQQQQPKEAAPSPPQQQQQPPSDPATRPSAFPPVQAELPRTPLRKVVLVEREVHTSRSASPRRSSELAPPLPQQQEGLPPGSDFGYASPVNSFGPGVVPASTVNPHYPMPPPTLLPPSPFAEQHPQHAAYGQQPYYAHPQMQPHPQQVQQASMHDPIYAMNHSPAYSHGAMQQQMPMVPYSPAPMVPGFSDSDSDSDDLQPLVPYRTPSRSQQAYAQIQASPNVLVNVHLNFVNIHDRA